jgi:hypothetical protein
MEGQELTGQAGVGGGEGTGAGAPAGAGAVPVQPTTGQGQAIAGGQGAPAAAEAQPPAPVERVDLTQFEDFRRWQSERDRREAQLRQELQARDQQMTEMQRTLNEMRLRDADPEEVAAYYQSELERVQAESQSQAAAMQERAEIVRQGQELLTDLGLSPDTPGLEWSSEPSWDGLARLATSAARVLRLQGQAVGGLAAADAQAAAHQARVEALREAGVTRTTTASGAATPAADNPIAEVSDPSTLLELGFRGTREKRTGGRR